MSEIQSWFHNLPPVTKWVFSLSALSTLLGALGVVTFDRMALFFDPIYREFQIWRLITTFLFHGLSLSFLMNMMFLLRFGQNLERVRYAGRSADFLWMLFICAGLLLIPGFYFRIPLLANCLIMSIIYLWARLNAETTVSFMFGLQFKAKYLPWAMVAFTLLVGGNPLAEIFGIIAGHIYYLLSELVPRDYGMNLVKTPGFVVGWFPEDQVVYVPNQPQQGPVQNAGPMGPRYTWGSGSRLGGH